MMSRNGWRRESPMKRDSDPVTRRVDANSLVLTSSTLHDDPSYYM